MKTHLTLVFLFFISASYAQSLNDNWKQDLNKDLTELKNCNPSGETGVSPCNKFMGNALKTVYSIDDFYSKDEGRHMLVSEINFFLENSPKWKLLGQCYDQKVLKEAQDLANAKKAVVAVYVNEEGLGHMTVIVPGEMKYSGTWGFLVPNSASLFPADPERSYIDKGLSYSFNKSHIKGIRLYARTNN